MSQEAIYMNLYEKIIYNLPAERIDITYIENLSIQELLENYEDELHNAIEQLRYVRAIKRSRIYGDKLYLYV